MQITTTGLVKQYASVTAVQSLSFEVGAGEIFALLGPNGAGKSSTIRMLIGLTKPDAGEIAFNTEAGILTKLDPKSFGYLPEERGLFQDRSLIDTLLYFARLKGMEKGKALEQAEYWLTEFDLWQRKDELLKSLSKGNQQKVQLISAILHQPDLLILDEPFSGLDPLNQEKVIDFLHKLKAKGMTIILSAHQMALVEKLADRFLLMSSGQALLYGSLEEIRASVSLGEQLLLEFEQATDSASLLTTPGIAHAEQLHECRVRLTLAQGEKLPDMLAVLMQQHRIVSLSTQSVDLHSIYINSLQDKEQAA